MSCNTGVAHGSLGLTVYSGAQKHFCHLERSHLLLLCSIVNKVIRWPHCLLKRDLLNILDICYDIVS